MAYKLFSPHSPSEHEILQWTKRDLENEVKSIKNRTILQAFNVLNIYKKPLKILEAGCGLGGWVQYFKSQGHEVVGVEYVESVIEEAKKINPDMAIVKGDITTLEFPENFFDVYVSLGVLEHFEEGPDRALSEAFRVLRPGGLIFVAVPLLTPLRLFLAHPLRNLYFFLNALRGKKNFFWEYRYTSKELENYLQNHNFDIVGRYVDDYSEEEHRRHLGLWADFFFLRDRGGIWELNIIGKILLKIMRALFSPWDFCSGILFVGRVKKE